MTHEFKTPISTSQSLRIQVSIRTPSVGTPSAESVSQSLRIQVSIRTLRDDAFRRQDQVSIPSYSGQHSYGTFRHDSDKGYQSQSLRIQVSIRTQWKRHNREGLWVSIPSYSGQHSYWTYIGPVEIEGLNPFVFRSAFVRSSTTKLNTHDQVSIPSYSGQHSYVIGGQTWTANCLNPFVFRSAFVPSLSAEMGEAGASQSLRIQVSIRTPSLCLKEQGYWSQSLRIQVSIRTNASSLSRIPNQSQSLRIQVSIRTWILSKNNHVF